MYKVSKSTLRPLDEFQLSGQAARRYALRELLITMRDDQVQTINHLMRAKVGTGTGVQCDQMGPAYRQPHLTFRPRFIGLAEGRYAAIWMGFNPLEKGQYGPCNRCGSRISIE
jgi:hypothetical protein